jgi:hypothetical protein
LRNMLFGRYLAAGAVVTIWPLLVVWWIWRRFTAKPQLDKKSTK